MNTASKAPLGASVKQLTARNTSRPRDLLRPNRSDRSAAAAKLLLITGLAVLELLPTSAAAQTSTSSTVEVLIVTSRRAKENLQQSPVAVTALSEFGLDVRGVTDTIELGNFTPNATFDFASTFSGASSSFQGFIRGIGQTDFAINSDPGVGVYIDDVYIARTVGAVFDLYDIQQVEILKGPQGTLFGRNTIGGALNIRTARPNADLKLKGRTSIGRYNYVAADVFTNVPIADNLYSTVSFALRQQDGFQDRLNFAGENAGNLIPATAGDLGTNGLAPGGLDNQSVRAKLLWEASDVFESMVSADYSRIRDAAPMQSVVAVGSQAFAEDPGFDTNLNTGLVSGSLATLYNGCLVLDNIPPQAGFPRPLCQNLPRVLQNANADADPNNDVPLYSDQFIIRDGDGNIEIDQTYSNGANFSNIDSWGVSWVNTLNFGRQATVKSITAFRKLDAAFGRDNDGSPHALSEVAVKIDQLQVSQELQVLGRLFDRLDYTVGAFYFREDATQTDDAYFFGGILNVEGDNTQTTDSIAGFGELNLEITSGLKLIGGARVTYERKEVVIDQQNVSNLYGSLAGVVDADGDPALPRANADGSPNINFLAPDTPFTAEFQNISLRTGVAWQIVKPLFSYFTFSQGFKSGGFTTRLTTPFNPDFDGEVPIDSLDFDPEISNNFEVGIKSALFGGRARVNAAGFYNLYEDLQISVQRGSTTLTDNSGSARIFGFEIEAEVVPTADLYLTAAFGYLNAEFVDIDESAEELNDESRIPNAPEFTLALAANYTLRLDVGEIGFNVNYSWRSETFNDALNLPELTQPAVGLLGAQISFAPPSGAWKLAVIGRNLTNTRFITTGTGGEAFSIVAATYNRPVEWRVALDWEL